MRKEQYLGLCAVFFVFLLLLPGCKKDPYKIVEFEGRVTLAGAPLENAVIVFQPSEGVGKNSTGPVLKDGKFHAIYSVHQDGVKAGLTKIYFMPPPDRSPPNEAAKEAFKLYGSVEDAIEIDIKKKEKDYQLDLPKK